MQFLPTCAALQAELSNNHSCGTLNVRWACAPELSKNIRSRAPLPAAIELTSCGKMPGVREHNDMNSRFPQTLYSISGTFDTRRLKNYLAFTITGTLAINTSTYHQVSETDI